MYFFIARHTIQPPDFSNISFFGTPDNTKVEILRPALFFHEGQKITMGKLREFFTELAIQKFIADGFIKVLEDESDRDTSTK